MDDKCLLDVINDPDALSNFLTADHQGIQAACDPNTEHGEVDVVSSTINLSSLQPCSTIAQMKKESAVNSPRNTNSPIIQYSVPQQKQQIVQPQVIGQGQQISQGQIGQIVNTGQGQTVLIGAPMQRMQTVTPSGQIANGTAGIQNTGTGSNIVTIPGATANQISVQGTLIQTSTGNRILIPSNAIMGQQVNIGGLGNVILQPQINSSQTQVIGNTFNSGSQIQLANGTVLQIPSQLGQTTSSVIQPNIISTGGAKTNAVQSVGNGINLVNVGQGQINVGQGQINLGQSQVAGQILVQRNPQTGQNIILQSLPPNFVQIQPANTNSANRNITGKKLILPQPVSASPVIKKTVTVNAPVTSMQSATVSNIATRNLNNVNSQVGISTSFPTVVFSTLPQQTIASSSGTVPILVSTCNTSTVSSTTSTNTRNIQLQLPPQIQKAIGQIMSQVKKISSQPKLSEEDQRVLEQLKGMQQKLLSQARLLTLKNQTSNKSLPSAIATGGSIAATATATTTSGISKNLSGLILTADSQLKTVVVSTSVSNNVAVTNVPGNILKPSVPNLSPTGAVSTQVMIAGQVINLVMTPEKRDKLQEKLSGLTLEQQKKFLQSITKNLPQNQKISHGQGQIVNTVIPITVQQVGKGINQIRPILITTLDSLQQKGIKRPSSVLTKSSLLTQVLTKDQLGVLRSDTKSPFFDLKDAAKRLMRYHVYQAKDPSLEELHKADMTFDNVSETLLKKSNKMIEKYRGLLWDDSKRIDPSPEMVMIDRMFVNHEQQILKEDNKFAKDNPGKYDVGDLDKSLLDSDIDVLGESDTSKSDIKMSPFVKLEDIGSPPLKKEGCVAFKSSSEVKTEIQDNKPKLTLSIKMKPNICSDTGELRTPMYAIKTPALHVVAKAEHNLSTLPAVVVKAEHNLSTLPAVVVKAEHNLSTSVKIEADEQMNYAGDTYNYISNTDNDMTETGTGSGHHSDMDVEVSLNEVNNTDNALEITSETSEIEVEDYLSGSAVNGYVDPVTGLLTEPPVGDLEGLSDAESEPYGVDIENTDQSQTMTDEMEIEQLHAEDEVDVENDISQEVDNIQNSEQQLCNNETEIVSIDSSEDSESEDEISPFTQSGQGQHSTDTVPSSIYEDQGQHNTVPVQSSIYEGQHNTVPVQSSIYEGQHNTVTASSSIYQGQGQHNTVTAPSSIYEGQGQGQHNTVTAPSSMYEDLTPTENGTEVREFAYDIESRNYKHFENSLNGGINHEENVLDYDFEDNQQHTQEVQCAIDSILGINGDDEDLTQDYPTDTYDSIRFINNTQADIGNSDLCNSDIGQFVVSDNSDYQNPQEPAISADTVPDADLDAADLDAADLDAADLDAADLDAAIQSIL